MAVFALSPGAPATAARTGCCPWPSCSRCPGTPQALLVPRQRSCQAARRPVMCWRTSSNCPFCAGEPTFICAPSDSAPRDKYTRELSDGGSCIIAPMCKCCPARANSSNVTLERKMPAQVYHMFRLDPARHLTAATSCSRARASLTVAVPSCQPQQHYLC